MTAWQPWKQQRRTCTTHQRGCSGSGTWEALGSDQNQHSKGMSTGRKQMGRSVSGTDVCVPHVPAGHHVSATTSIPVPIHGQNSLDPPQAEHGASRAAQVRAPPQPRPLRPDMRTGGESAA